MSGGSLATWLGVWRRQAARRRAAEGWAADVWSAVGPLLVTAAVTPLIRPVFLGYLQLPAERWSEGTAGVLLRLSLLVGGWTALEAHQVVLRTGDREVLSPLPVAPAAVVGYELIRLVVHRWWLVPCAAVALAPLAWAAPAHWLAAVSVLLAVQLAALPAGAVGALLAIEVSDHPRWEPVLDALRGQNPRIQAALLWAPGVVLAIVGGSGALAVFGAMAAVDGQLVQAAWLAAPLLAGAGLAARLPLLSRRAWFRGTPLLQEIDARYAALERPEDVGRVYLDWAVRFLPVGLRTWALADLRHGWRARRSWITGAWAGGLAAGLAGWGVGPDAVATCAALAAGAGWLCASISGWMERDIPPFTRLLLPDRSPTRALARTLTVLAWLQPIAWIPAFPVAVRHGMGTAIGLFGFVELSLLAAAALGAALARVGLGLLGYAPAAALAAGVAATLGSRLW